MIIARDYVMIHFPKTGSSFARKVIKSIHDERNNARPIAKRILIRVGISKPEMYFFKVNKGGRMSGHGNIEDIPRHHKTKEVVSIARNPYTRLLSQFKYQSWIRNPGEYGKKAESHFKNFPNLSLEEFIDYKNLQATYRYEKNHSLSRLIREKAIGHQTIEFFQFYSSKPNEALLKLSNEYVESKSFLQDIKEINFVRQENLTEDLCHFLSEKGYHQHELEFIRAHKKINVSQTDKRIQWTPNAIDQIRFKERYLFEILKHYGMDYSSKVPKIP